MKKKHKLLILLIAMISTSFSAGAQLAITKWEQDYFSKKYLPTPYVNTFLPIEAFPSMNPFSSAKSIQQNYGPYVPKVYSYTELAFFCKLEVKMEKRAKLPIKMRLGDIDYVDWLEGKRDRY